MTYFDESIASGYESWYGTAEGKRAGSAEKAALRNLLGCLPGADTILETGCGTGHFTRWFAEQGLIATGMDNSSAMLAHTRGLDGIPF